MVWAQAGVMPETQYVASTFLVGVGVISLPLVALAVRRLGLRPFAMALLLMIAAACGWLQTLKCSSSIAAQVSPATHQAHVDFVPLQLHQELARDYRIQEEHKAELAVHRNTVSRYDTLHALSLPITTACVCILVACCVSDSRSFVILLLITSIAGVAVSLLAIIDLVTIRTLDDSGLPVAAGLITPQVPNGSSFGPFVNKNNAAGYLCMTLASTLGLLFLITKSNHDTGRQFDARTVWLLAFAAIQIVAVIASQSRGGVLAMIAGMLVLSVYTGRSKLAIRRPAWTAVILTILSAGSVLVFLDLQSNAEERFLSIFTLKSGSQVGRVAHVQDAWNAAIAYLPAGSGLGTYRYAVLPYAQSVQGSIWFVHADCMPMEWAVEGGLWMLSLVLAGVILFVRQLRSLPDSTSHQAAGAAAVGWFVLASQAIASCFDFGILIPANAMTAAILVGAATMNLQRQKAKWSSAIAGYALVIVTSGAMFLAWTTLQQHAQSSEQQRRWEQVMPDGLLPPEFKSALPLSNNPDLNFSACQLLMNQQQLASNRPGNVSWRRFNSDDAVTQQQVADQIYANPDLSVRRLLSFNGDKQRHLRLRPDLLESQSVESLRDARSLAVTALVQCPLHPMVRWPLIQTDFVREPAHPSSDRFSVRLADIADADLTTKLASDFLRLQPYNPSVAAELARLMFVFPGPGSSVPFLKRSIALRPGVFDTFWPMIEQATGNDPKQICDLIPNDPRVMLMIAKSRRIGSSIQKELLDRTSAMIAKPKPGISPIENARLAADVATQRGNEEEAIEMLEQAVRLDPSTFQYRSELITRLTNQRQFDRAILHLKRLMIQRPQDSSLPKKLTEIRKQQRLYPNQPSTHQPNTQ